MMIFIGEYGGLSLQLDRNRYWMDVGQEKANRFKDEMSKTAHLLIFDLVLRNACYKSIHQTDAIKWMPRNFIPMVERLGLLGNATSI